MNNINSDIKKSKSKSIFAKKIIPIIQTFTFIKKNILSFLLCYNFQPDIYIKIVFITLLVK